jgi:hypothetical protein
MSSEDAQERPAPAHHPPRVRKAIQILVFLIVVGALIFTSIFILTKKTGEADGPGKGKTPTPTPRATATLVIPTPTQALFYDTFQDNRHNWTMSDSGGFVRTISDGRLTLTATNPNTTLIEGLPNFVPYKDFTMTIRFIFEQGDGNDSIGVYLRGDTNLDHDYRFDINGDSTFDVAKELLDNNSQPQSFYLSAPGRVAALHPMGQTNTMTVEMRGSDISVRINDAPVCDLVDSDYPSGQIALFAKHGSTSPAVTASFSLFEIDRLPESESSPVP